MSFRLLTRTNAPIQSLQVLTCQEPVQALDGEALQAECCKCPKPCIFKSIRLIHQKSPFTKAYKIWAPAINMHHLNQTEVTSCVKGVLAFRISKKKKHHAKIKPLVRQSSALRQPTVEELADMVKGS